jgi:hypothetical protein
MVGLCDPQDQELPMSGRSKSRRKTDADRRAARLAELVAELTGCEQTGALHAVREHQDEDRPDVLSLVARAMIDVDAPQPDGFRVPAFLDADDGHEILDLADGAHPSSGGASAAGMETADFDDAFGRRLAHARTRVEQAQRPD